MYIITSDCLIDGSVPLKYTLQNAFDNNPATSFVENTDDDLMVIYFVKEYTEDNDKQFTIKEFAIINGYAQNNSLYNNNNRVKEIAYSTRTENTSEVELYRYKPRAYMSSYEIKNFSLVGIAERISYSNVRILNGSPFKPTIYETGYLFSSLCLIVTDIYKGNKYNDTCIAEINIKTEKGWLFGDIEN